MLVQRGSCMRVYITPECWCRSGFERWCRSGSGRWCRSGPGFGCWCHSGPGSGPETADSSGCPAITQNHTQHVKRFCRRQALHCPALCFADAFPNTSQITWGCCGWVQQRLGSASRGNGVGPGFLGGGGGEGGQLAHCTALDPEPQSWLLPCMLGPPAGSPGCWWR